MQGKSAKHTHQEAFSHLSHFYLLYFPDCDSLAALLFNVSTSELGLVQTVGADATVLRNLTARALATAPRPPALLRRGILGGLHPRLPGLQGRGLRLRLLRARHR